MVRTAGAVIGLLIVTGCTPTLKQSSSAGGMIRLGGVVQGESKAIAMAEAECAKHGKVARVTGKDILSESLSYECAAP